MGTVMLGTEVAKAMKEELIKKIESLKEKKILPNLTIIRVGSKEEDLSYERGAKKKMESLGIDVHILELPETITQEEFVRAFQKVNDDENVHGILVFLPLPRHLDENKIKLLINPNKDVDCMNKVNVAKIMENDRTGFAPCTAEAVMKMLDYYQVDLESKKVTVIGRSMVVGKPLSMLLLNKNATVTITHSKTKDLKQACLNSDILIAAVGKARMVHSDMISKGAIVVDVGINVDENGNLCGDVDFDAVLNKVSFISPVPKGIGSITTSILAEHVIRSASYLHNIK